jgi:tRNA-dihydrouridine synthase B
MRIGPYELSSNVVLAPMAGVTDRPFRILCRSLGAGLAASEMLTSDTRLWNTPKSRRRMDHAGEPEPRVVQLAGSEPEALAEAARQNVDLGAQIIDVNMGCPAKKVCGKACGSALLKDEPLVARLLEAVVRAVNVPVTLKIRTGWSAAQRNGTRIARIAEAAGIQALAVHGRTREDFYTGAAEYETIREIKSAIRIPVLANGDIDDPNKARRVLDYTGADAVMIGRASHGAPWIFRAVNSGLLKNFSPPENSDAEKKFTAQRSTQSLSRAEVRAIILAHLEALYAFYGEDTGVRVARKHLGWYFASLPDSAHTRASLMAEATTASQFAAARGHLDGWVVDGAAQAA